MFAQLAGLEQSTASHLSVAHQRLPRAAAGGTGCLQVPVTCDLVTKLTQFLHGMTLTQITCDSSPMSISKSLSSVEYASCLNFFVGLSGNGCSSRALLVRGLVDTPCTAEFAFLGGMDQLQ